MTRREVAFVTVGIVAGLLLTSAGWSLHTPSRTRPKPPPVAVEGESADMEALRSANRNLTKSLETAEQTIAQLRGQIGPAPVGTRSASPSPPSGPPRGQDAAPHHDDLTAEQVLMQAKHGYFSVRTPCVREPPWTPPQHIVDRLGMTSSDVAALTDVYAQSAKRVSPQIKQLCASALGSPDIAERIGAQGCLAAVTALATREPEAAEKSVQRLSEIQAGNQPLKAAPEASVLEKLMVALMAERSTFDADLQAKLEGKLGREKMESLKMMMCSDYSTVQLTKLERPPSPFPSGSAPPARRAP